MTACQSRGKELRKKSCQKEHKEGGEGMQQETLPKISVIMSIYNQWNKVQLDRAVESVLEQTFPEFEFIIYNDGSDEVVWEYLQKYARQDSRIVLINNPVNHGLAYSLNTCIDVARGKYLARMDGDDICAPERLAVQYAFMEAHPEIAYVGCNARLIDEKGVWGIRRMPENPDKRAFLRFSPFIHPTVMIRRCLFEGAPAYRSSKETWRCEDYELFMRLWKLGYRGCNIQQELFFYREDRDAYKKRKRRYRLDEMRLRYRNFKELGILFPTGWLYVTRPLVAALIPSGLILAMKRLYHLRDNHNEKRSGQEIAAVSEGFAESSDAV